MFPFTSISFPCLRVIQGYNKLDEFWNNGEKWLEGWKIKKNGKKRKVLRDEGGLLKKKVDKKLLNFKHKFKKFYHLKKNILPNTNKI